METVAQKIKNAMQRKGFSTVKECAIALGFAYELLRKVVGEDHIPKDEQLIKYANKLGIDPKNLLFTAYYQKAPLDFKGFLKSRILESALVKSNQVPLLNWRDLFNGINILSANDFIQTNLENQNLFALTISDDSMEPKFLRNETIIVSPDKVHQEGDYIVGHKGKETFLRQLKEIRKFFFLHPINSKYDSIEVDSDIRIIGRVIQKRMDFF